MIYLIYLNSPTPHTCLFLPPFFPPQMLCYSDNIDHITMVLKIFSAFPLFSGNWAISLTWHQVPPWSGSCSALQYHLILPSLKLSDPTTLIFFPLLNKPCYFQPSGLAYAVPSTLSSLFTNHHHSPSHYSNATSLEKPDMNPIVESSPIIKWFHWPTYFSSIIKYIGLLYPSVRIKYNPLHSICWVRKLKITE